MVLLLDVLLVISYFIIVKGADVVRTPDGLIAGENPSAANETQWIMWVFLQYLMWDFLTNAVIHKKKNDRAKEFWARGKWTLLCFGLAVLAWALLHAVTGRRRVIVADLALLSLVFLFRALKAQPAKAWVVVLGIAYGVFLIWALL